MASRSIMIASPVREMETPRGVWSLILGIAERAASLLLLILVAPLMLMTGALIVALCGRSPLVAHLRIGQFGAPFWTLKFRTMWIGRSFHLRLVEHIVDDSGPELKNSTDPRVTSGFARFCRRFSIDELPQLVNILRGEMSLVA